MPESNEKLKQNNPGFDWDFGANSNKRRDEEKDKLDVVKSDEKKLKKINNTVIKNSPRVKNIP